MSWSCNKEINYEDFEILLAKANEESLRCHNEVDLSQQQQKNERKKEDIGLSSQFSGKAGPVLYEGIEANGFHLSAGSTYIYPTNYPVRQYQASIVKTALFKNTLVSLPTGLGKTFIAAVVMYNFYRWYPCGKVVFMAPTRPLVAQQTKACHHIMNIPQEDTTEMTGAQSAEQRSELWKSKRVFYLTPQVMVNDLKTKICPASLIKCVVIDEAHRATKDYAYCQVLKILSESDAVFRVLGLSATPGNDVSSVQQVIQNLHIAALEMRSEESLDVAPFTHSREVNPVIVELSENIRRVKEDLLQIFEKYAKKLKDFKALNQNISNISKFQVLKACEKFRANPPRGVPPAMIGSLISDFTVCMSLAHSLELLQIYGLRAFYNYLTDDSGEKTKAASTRLRSDEHLREMLRRLQSCLYPKPNENRPYNWSHPKLQKLVTCLTEHFNKAENKNTTKAIIFCQYRVVVTEIVELLNKSKPLIKATEFIGQSGGKEKGMPQAKQIQIMKDFRNGIINCLVATCVAEEGLDIGEVDLIILMETQKSPVRLVQRLGRTGRKRKGCCIVLLTKGKEEQKYHDAMATRKSYVQNIVNAPAVKSSLCQNSPRMIPSECNPVQQLVHIHASNFESPARPAPKKQVDIRKCLSAQVSNSPFSSDEDLIKAFNELGGMQLSFDSLPPHQELWPKIKGDKITVEELFSKSITCFSEWNEWNYEEYETYNIPHSSQTKLLCSLLNTPRQPPLTLYDLASGSLECSQQKEEKNKKADASPKNKNKRQKKNDHKKNKGMDIRSCINLINEKNIEEDEIIEILSENSNDALPNSPTEPEAKRAKISVPNNTIPIEFETVSCYEENNNLCNYLSKYMLPKKSTKRSFNFKRTLPDLDDILSYVTHDILFSMAFNRKSFSQKSKSKSPVNNLESSLLSSTAFEFDDLFADDSNSQIEISKRDNGQCQVFSSKEKVAEIFDTSEKPINDKAQSVEFINANDESHSSFDIDDILNGHVDPNVNISDDINVIHHQQNCKQEETPKRFKTLTDILIGARKRNFNEQLSFDEDLVVGVLNENTVCSMDNNYKEIDSLEKKPKMLTNSFIDDESSFIDDAINKPQADLYQISLIKDQGELTPAINTKSPNGTMTSNTVLNVVSENKDIQKVIEVREKGTPAKGFKTLTSSFVDCFNSFREKKCSQNQHLENEPKKESSQNVEKLPWFSDDDADFEKIDEVFSENPNFCSTPTKSPPYINNENQGKDENVCSPLSMKEFAAPSKMICSTPLMNSKTVKTFKKNKIISRNIPKTDKKTNLTVIDEKEEESINLENGEKQHPTKSEKWNLSDILENDDKTTLVTQQNSTMLGITQMVSLIEREKKNNNLNPDKIIEDTNVENIPKISNAKNSPAFSDSDIDLFYDIHSGSHKKCNTFNQTNALKSKHQSSHNNSNGPEKSLCLDKTVHDGLILKDKIVLQELEPDINLENGIELVDAEECEDILPTQKYNMPESRNIPVSPENEFHTEEFNIASLENELNLNNPMNTAAASVLKSEIKSITQQTQTTNSLDIEKSSEEISPLIFIESEIQHMYKPPEEHNNFETNLNITLINADDYENLDGLLTQKYNISGPGKRDKDPEDEHINVELFSEDHDLVKENIIDFIELKNDFKVQEPKSVDDQHLKTEDLSRRVSSLQLQKNHKLQNTCAAPKTEHDISFIDIEEFGDFDDMLTQKHNFKDPEPDFPVNNTCPNNSIQRFHNSNLLLNNIIANNCVNNEEKSLIIVEKEIANTLKNSVLSEKSKVVEYEMVNSQRNSVLSQKTSVAVEKEMDSSQKNSILSEPSQMVHQSQAVNFKKFSKKLVFPNKAANALPCNNNLTNVTKKQLEAPTNNSVNLQNPRMSSENIHSEEIPSYSISNGNLNKFSFSEPKAKVSLFPTKKEKHLMSDDSDEDIFKIPAYSKRANDNISRNYPESEKLDVPKNHRSTDLVPPEKHKTLKANKKHQKHHGLIETEADVSGELSSDDTDGSSLDDLDNSFINDDTECFTQTMYLKSVKSPVGRGKFKIPNSINYAGNVYSQHVIEEESEYMNDSFCVGSDNETDESPDKSLSFLEIAERKLRDKNNKANTKKKRRRILNNTSEENSSAEKKLPSPILASSEPLPGPPVNKRRRRLLSDSESDSSPLGKKKCFLNQPQGSHPSISNNPSGLSRIVGNKNNCVDLTKSDSEEESFIKFNWGEKNVSSHKNEQISKNSLIFNKFRKKEGDFKRSEHKHIKDKLFKLNSDFEKNLESIKNKYFGSDDSSD